MLTCLSRTITRRNTTLQPLRSLSTTTAPSRDRTRKEGDISSVFASLSGAEAAPLPSKFADIKTSLIRNKETAIINSWTRLLSALKEDINHINSTGSDIIPTIDYAQINNHSRVHAFGASLKKRGTAVIRNVVPESLALDWKAEIQEYIRRNPQTKAFPADNPAVYELYWSPGQVKARAHPDMLEAQKFVMGFWHSKEKGAKCSTENPLTYADRVRIRGPGDAGFALGPHVDGGSVERWEPDGYGIGGVFDRVFAGEWESFDPWESSCRLPASSDNYNGAGACSMFRMYQGWLAMSHTGPNEGTLLVNPLFKLASAYILLRPFFSPINPNTSTSGYLDASNWALDASQSSTLHGASLGMAQELNDALHPHLDLAKTMVHVPKVQPGDYVVWHCDVVHAVDKVHKGKNDSSVLYIPACPLTEENAKYIARQREAFLQGLPGPDFPGGKGESEHLGRMTRDDVKKYGGVIAERGLGLVGFEGDGMYGEMNSAMGL